MTSSNDSVANRSADGVVTINGSLVDSRFDTHTVTVNWGDGTVEEVVVDQDSDTFSGEHDYEGGGLFTITATATDSDGAASTAASTTAGVDTA